jgi:hypothetical protein
MFDWWRRKSTQRTELERRMSDALVDYPVYELPEWDPVIKSLRDLATEYAQFFLNNRAHRLDSLRKFLAKFDVALSFDDAGVIAVSTWHPLYADLLLDEWTEEFQLSYIHFDQPWTAGLLGLNVVFDLGVYFGECMLFRNPTLRWTPMRYYDHQDRYNVAHPIFGVHDKVFDPVRSMYVTCAQIREVRRGRRYVYADAETFFRRIQAQVQRLSG